MNLTFDARMLRSSGIGRFIRHSISGLARKGHTLTLVGEPESLRDFCRQEEVKARIVSWTAPIYGLAEQAGAGKFRRDPSDTLIHAPQFNYPLLGPGPDVVTIHDLIQLQFPQWFSRAKGTVLKMMLNQLQGRVQRIHCNSRTTADSIRQFFPAVASKTRVVYLGVEEPPSTLDDPGISAPYFLYVGNLKSHKNVEGLITAFARWREAGGQERLVIVGKDYSGMALQERARKERVASFIDWRGEAEPCQLWGLYAGATALIQPSFWEGFGFPPLEAMKCGTPVIASTAGSLPEILQDKALFFDPYKGEELVQAMKKISQDGILRQELGEVGKRHAAGFTWQKTVDGLEALYREILAGA